MKIVYLGSGEFGIDCLNALASSRHSLQFIVTGSAQPAGRGRRPTPTPVARFAKEHSIPFMETDNVNTPKIIEKIARFQPDLIIVIAFGQKIENELINLPPKGTINVHASLLPKYRGAAPINWAIINGEQTTGITIIKLIERMDAGPIAARIKTQIQPHETAGQLHDRLAKLAAPLLAKTIDKIENDTLLYTPQDDSKATLAPKLKKSDGFIDFNEPAELLERKIRGFWPWPGAAAIYSPSASHPIARKCLRAVIARAQLIKASNPASLPAGTLDENLNIICGQDALKIIQIKPAGSTLMDFKDFVNGYHSRPGDRFVKIES